MSASLQINSGNISRLVFSFYALWRNVNGCYEWFHMWHLTKNIWWGVTFSCMGTINEGREEERCTLVLTCYSSLQQRVTLKSWRGEERGICSVTICLYSVDCQLVNDEHGKQKHILPAPHPLSVPAGSRPTVQYLASLSELPQALQPYYTQGYVLAALHPIILSVGRTRSLPFSLLYRAILARPRPRYTSPNPLKVKLQNHEAHFNTFYLIVWHLGKQQTPN